MLCRRHGNFSCQNTRNQGEFLKFWEIHRLVEARYSISVTVFWTWSARYQNVNGSTKLIKTDELFYTSSTTQKRIQKFYHIELQHISTDLYPPKKTQIAVNDVGSSPWYTTERSAMTAKNNFKRLENIQTGFQGSTVQQRFKFYWKHTKRRRVSIHLILVICSDD